MLKAPEKPRKSFAPTHKGPLAAGFSVAGRSNTRTSVKKGLEPAQNAPETPLVKRARRMTIGKPLARLLVNSAKGPLMGKAYSRTLYQCGTLLDQEGGKLKQYFCGYRWCVVCSAIRTARAFHAYGSQIDQWEDPWFVTLTIPNCTAEQLKSKVREMHQTINLLARTLKNRFGKENVVFIRSTECTYSDKRAAEGKKDLFHPHMHLAVKGEAVAKEMYSQWLKRWEGTHAKGQDCRKATAGICSEVLKYSVKLASDKRGADGSRKVVPGHALNTMFEAFRSMRLLAATGLKSATGEEVVVDELAELELDVGTPAISRVTESVVWAWSEGVTDWVSHDGECMTGYEPSEHIRRFVKVLNEAT
jgi:hypothetical protein